MLPYFACGISHDVVYFLARFWFSTSTGLQPVTASRFSLWNAISVWWRSLLRGVLPFPHILCEYMSVSVPHTSPFSLLWVGKWGQAIIIIVVVCISRQYFVQLSNRGVSHPSTTLFATGEYLQYIDDGDIQCHALTDRCIYYSDNSTPRYHRL